MRFENLEYIVTKNVPDESITITKKAIDKWADHYLGVASEHQTDKFKFGYYCGKAEALLDILKHFEEEEA